MALHTRRRLDGWFDRSISLLSSIDCSFDLSLHRSPARPLARSLARSSTHSPVRSIARLIALSLDWSLDRSITRSRAARSLDPSIAWLKSQFSLRICWSRQPNAFISSSPNHGAKPFPTQKPTRQLGSCNRTPNQRKPGPDYKTGSQLVHPWKLRSSELFWLVALNPIIWRIFIFIRHVLTTSSFFNQESSTPANVTAYWLPDEGRALDTLHPSSIQATKQSAVNDQERYFRSLTNRTSHRS